MACGRLNRQTGRIETAVCVEIIGQYGDLNRPVGQRRSQVVIGCGLQIGRRQHGQEDGGSATLGGCSVVTDLVFELVAAAVAVGRRVGDRTLAIVGRGGDAMAGQHGHADGAHIQLAVRVVVIGQHVDGGRPAKNDGRRAVVDNHRRLIRRRRRHRDKDVGRAALWCRIGVAGPIGELIRTAEAAVWRIGNRAVSLGRCAAVAGLAGNRDRTWVHQTVRIAVIGQHVDIDGLAADGRSRVIAYGRRQRGVRVDGDGDDGRVRP